ncbi:MAG: toprim domain-containing protein [Rickettsiales bacterium]|nr:toprim domain-containing protein [Rickettsiales bacterium]
MMAIEIAKALNGKKSGRGWLCKCPAHDDSKASLSIADGENGKLLVYCHARCDARVVLEKLRSRGFLRNDSTSKSPSKDAPKPTLTIIKEWSAEAINLWRRTTALRGSLAENYLLARGCNIPDCDDLRFLSNYKGWPAMVARVTCPLTNAPFTLHFTLLDHDGRRKAPVEKQKLWLFGHRSKGGVIRLSRDEDVTMGLAIAEGIETALCCDWKPIWATGSAGNMALFPVLNGIEALSIFADHDKSGTGLSSAKQCAARWQKAGREVRFTMPPHVGTDWADL